MLSSIYFSVLFVVVSCVNLPKTDIEYKQILTKYIIQCNKEHPVEMRELFNLEKYIVPTNRDTKCLLACAYKKDGAMTKSGLYNVEHAKKVLESMTKGDEKRKKNGEILLQTCSKVNDKPVSDGEKGCDRAALMFKCITENGPKLGFNA